MAIRGSALGAIVPVSGPAGTTGQSAYDIWVNLPGNAGKSKADFIASLKGADGVTQDISNLLSKYGDVGFTTILAKYGSLTAEKSVPMSEWVGFERIYVSSEVRAGEDPQVDIGLALQRAIDKANGTKLIILPAGVSSILTPVYSKVPVRLYGYGTGSGPGPAAQSNDNASVLLQCFPTGDVITVESLYPSIFRDFRIDVLPALRAGDSGSGIVLMGPAPGSAVGGVNGATNFNSKIINVTVGNKDLPIRLLRTGASTVEGCFVYAWKSAGMRFHTSAGVEGGAGNVCKNTFFSNGLTGIGPAVWCQIGYTGIFDNLIGGGRQAVLMEVANYPAGAPKIGRNWIEDQEVESIRVRSADGNVISMLDIFENEFSIVGTRASFRDHIVIEDTGFDYLETLRIFDNVFRSLMNTGYMYLGSQVIDAYINIQTGNGIHVSRNSLTNLDSTTTPIGVRVRGFGGDNSRLKGQICVEDTRFLGSIQRYDLTAAALLRDEYPMTAAAMATIGAVLDGSRIFVSDRTPGALSTPGSGTSVLRRGGQWTAPANALSFRNRIVNGAFSINQRCVASAATAYAAGTYTRDRWKAGAAGCTVAWTDYGNADAMATISAGSLVQVIEGREFLREGGTYVLSWPGTAQGRINGGAYAASPIVVTALPAGTNATVEFGVGTVGGFGGMVQFEPEAAPTTPERRDGELRLCQRYFQKSYDPAVAPGTAVGNGSATVNANAPGGGAVFDRALQVSMRATPTLTIYDGTGAAGKVSYYNGTWNGGGAITASTGRTQSLFVQTNISGSGQINFDYTLSAEL